MKNDNIVIKVEKLNKIYRIGLKEGMHDSLGKSFFEFIKSPIKNYKKYSSLYNFNDVNFNDPDSDHGREDILWAIRDVSFELKKGEVLGLIGGNGAGKSTLLKMLARITDPTSGQAEITGRISSLLEVGTGFHQELTGRENVYLNGTILGMRKEEVDRKFDEIVEFSGVEKFIDTPVKRYSSGMTVRLAFSVASVLEPEILLVDEVLAVGDASFQAKCLGKMSEVSQQGRTIIFVSHNMAAIEHLCSRVILLEHGNVKLDTDPDHAISKYYESLSSSSNVTDLAEISRTPDLLPVIQQVKFINSNGDSVSSVQVGDTLTVHIHYSHSDILKDSYFGIIFETLVGVKVFWVQTKLQKGNMPDLATTGIIECKIPRLPLVPGVYFLTVGCGVQGQQLDLLIRGCQLQVTEAAIFGPGQNVNPTVSWVFVYADWEVMDGVVASAN